LGLSRVFRSEAIDGASFNSIVGRRFFKGFVILGKGVYAFNFVNGVALESLLPL
jgi:hypothetical protein